MTMDPKKPESCCGDPEDCQHFLSGDCPMDKSDG